MFCREILPFFVLKSLGPCTVSRGRWLSHADRYRCHTQKNRDSHEWHFLDKVFLRMGFGHKPEVLLARTHACIVRWRDDGHSRLRKCHSGQPPIMERYKEVVEAQPIVPPVERLIRMWA